MFMSNTAASPTIARHRAAITRADLSKPVRLALEAGLLTPVTSFFDYGCGRGGDLRRLRDRGFKHCAGYDPHYRPDTSQTSASVVNLGYVINVIECPEERRQVLVSAWNLTEQVLIVAAQVAILEGNGYTIYGDGIVTSHNTFQKYYEQEELKSYIDQVLGVDSIPVALGIYFVFRDEAHAQSFRAKRWRSRITTPRICTAIRQFDEHQNLLTPFMSFISDRGRLPSPGELGCYAGDMAIEVSLLEIFGSFKSAFRVVLKATNSTEWDAITDRRRQDALLYLALTKFTGRPRFSELSLDLQQDFKVFFGSYQQACIAADLLLINLGDLDRLWKVAQASLIGKKLPKALYVHLSALDQLDPQLRLYEGCASRTVGRLDEANLIKFSFDKPKISYLHYPKFEADPHPALKTSMTIDLRNLQVIYRDYDNRDNPPILHRKETFLATDHPQYEKFAKLTRQEEIWGLLDSPQSIGTLQGWERRLQDCGAMVSGHRLIERKNLDPYRLKILRADRRRRQLAAKSTSGSAPRSAP
ncbi:DNA phosphorothioation-associated putative methyltransferase [Limnothrix redekei LRLZ20PSL1]|uniref:DNA phosphorothioation-associated putative methyltransferase n=2 Tax=Limnothrix TaxID=132605 RepID=A0ABW7CAP9_9CYAN